VFSRSNLCRRLCPFLLSISPLSLLPDSIAVTPSTSTVIVNGENILLQAYNVNGRNFFRLIDIANVLIGTPAQFHVDLDYISDAILITSQTALDPFDNEPQMSFWSTFARATTFPTLLDGTETNVTTYDIGNGTFFMLRELGEYLGFNVDWDAETNAILIST
jgi:hypothetical protein